MIAATNILNGNMFKASLVLFFLSSILVGIIKKLRALFTKNKKLAILYIVFILITFALAGLLSSHKVLNDTPLSSFIGIQILFLLLGILHLYILDKYFPGLSSDKNNLFYEFLFTVVILFMGFIAYMNVVNSFRPSYSFMFLGAGVCFIIPFLFKKLYESAFDIPVPVYKQWKYPLEGKIKDPTPTELTNPIVISFEFQKKFDHSEITNFRVKAPENMEFSKLFYFFINDYNERHPESHIEYLNGKTQQPHEWIFYFKPNWFGHINHIDFSNTVLKNDIKENDIIVCQRVMN